MMAVRALVGIYLHLRRTGLAGMPPDDPHAMVGQRIHALRKMCVFISAHIAQLTRSIYASRGPGWGEPAGHRALPDAVGLQQLYRSL